MQHKFQLRQEPNGDCLRTCLACILDMEPEEIPDFGAMSTEVLPSGYQPWWIELQSWCKQRGYFFLEMALTEQTPLMSLPYYPLCLFMGRTKNGHNHCIVGRIEDTQLVPVWNPWPKAKLVGVMSLGFLVPLDCSRMALKQNDKIISLS